MPPSHVSNVVIFDLNISRLCEEGEEGEEGEECDEDDDGDEKVVTGLRTELWEKERKLTDIRLEALSSAHQLEQLQDAMSSMQVRVVCCF